MPRFRARLAFWGSSWCSMSCSLLNILLEFNALASGIYYLELVFMFEQSAGHRLLGEKVCRPQAFSFLTRHSSAQDGPRGWAEPGFGIFFVVRIRMLHVLPTGSRARFQTSLSISNDQVMEHTCTKLICVCRTPGTCCRLFSQEVALATNAALRITCTIGARLDRHACALKSLKQPTTTNHNQPQPTTTTNNHHNHHKAKTGL